MDLYEYQGKQFFASYDIPVSPGEAVTTVDDAVAAADRIGYPVVVKAQVQVGGRRRRRHQKLADDAARPRARPEHPRHGHQATPSRSSGSSSPPDIAEEYYASFTLDRAGQEAPRHAVGPGRREIEAVAESDPDAIAKIHMIDPSTACQPRGLPRGCWPRLNPTSPTGGRHPPLKLYRAYVRATPTWSRSTR